MAVAADGPRPSITPEKRARLMEALRAGNHVETACRFAGMPKRTFYNVLEAARRDDADPWDLEFEADVKKAQADAEVRNITMINKAGAEDWRAAAWFLERAYPERWGRNKREVDLTVSLATATDPRAAMQAGLDELAEILAEEDAEHGDEPQGADRPAES
ncbi:hypothetical protein D3C74_247980 [compost metagenome]